MMPLAPILFALASTLPCASNDGDTWQSLSELPPGPDRGARVAALLAVAPDELAIPAQQLAFAAANRAVEDFDLTLAISIQVALNDRVHAPWSAFNLALTLQKAGDPQGSDKLFARMLQQAAPDARAGLWGQRAIVALGAGHDVSGRAYLGHALALGDPDAAAVLARQSLARHNLPSARNGFRTALMRNQAHPWALRGWGLSLLPDPGPRESK